MKKFIKFVAEVEVEVEIEEDISDEKAVKLAVDTFVSCCFDSESYLQLLKKFKAVSITEPLADGMFTTKGIV